MQLRMSEVGPVIRFMLCCCACLFVAAAAASNSSADAAKKPRGPQELWQKFPLAGQGTVPAPPQPAPQTTRTLKAPLPPTAAQTPSHSRSGSSDRTKWVIAILVLAAIAVALIFAQITWGVLSRVGKGPRNVLRWLGDFVDRPADIVTGMLERIALRRRRLLDWLADFPDRSADIASGLLERFAWRQRRLLRWLGELPSRWADALSDATRSLLDGLAAVANFGIRSHGRGRHPGTAHRTIAKLPAFAMGGRALPASPSVLAEPQSHARLAFRVGRWRRRQEPMPQEEAPAASFDVHSRVALYSLRPREDLAERSDVRPEPDFVETSDAEHEDIVAPADLTEAAPETATTPEDPILVSVGLHVEQARQEHYALSLAAVQLQPQTDDLHPFDLRRTAEDTVHEFLGDVVGVEVLLGNEDVLWLIIPGVLPKRARTAADHLKTLLASGGTDVARVAVLGYPRDSTSAEGLVQRCKHLLADESSADDDGTAA